jgi:hypothetical protein
MSEIIKSSTKLCTIICTLGFAILIVGTHESGKLFPWLQIYVLLSSATILLSTLFGAPSIRFLTFIASGFSVSLRLFIYEWPASMIGQDPVGYAVGVIRIIQTGNLIELKEAFPVYGVLSAFHLFNSAVAIISGFNAKNVLIAIPILLGIMFPLTAATITTRHTNSTIAISISTVVAAVAATGVHFSYWPIAQTIAVLLWCGMIIIFMRIVSTNQKRNLVILFVLTSTLLFSHKMAIIFVAGTIGAALIIRKIDVGRLAFQKESKEDTLPRPNQLNLLFILVIALLAIQWVIMTTYVRSVIVGKIIAFLTSDLSISAVEPVVTDAVKGNSGIIGILVKPASLLSLVIIAATTSLILWSRNRTWSICLLLGSSLITGMLVGLSISGVGIIPPRRATLFSIPVFASIIGISLEYRLESESRLQISIILSVVFILIALQAGSGALAPNLPNEPRFFLTSEEKHAKEFMVEHSNVPVAMDHYYAGLQVGIDDQTTVKNLDQEGINLSRVKHINDGLLNSTLRNQSLGKILLRKMDVSKFAEGAYQLTWCPIQVLSNDSSYNRIFDTGKTVGFANRSPMAETPP